MLAMGAQQSTNHLQQQHQQQQYQQQQHTQQTMEGQQEQKPGGQHTSLAAHHAASKLAAMAAAGDVKQGPASAKNSPANSRSGSISQQGPFENQTQIQQTQQQPPTPANVAAPAFPGRPVSSRGHMLPQSAQMISEAERRREQEMEHIFAPQPGQIIAERYEFLKLMGRGTFSQVLLCRDLAATAGTDAEMAGDDDMAGNANAAGLISIPLKPKNVVAIKIIRDVARYRHAAEKEARILQHLAATKHSPCHPAQPLKELQTARGMQQDSCLAPTVSTRCWAGSAWVATSALSSRHSDARSTTSSAQTTSDPCSLTTFVISPSSC